MKQMIELGDIFLFFFFFLVNDETRERILVGERSCPVLDDSINLDGGYIR